MSLVICPDCGNQVSERAQVCPRCGAPIATLFDVNLIVKDIEEELEEIRYGHAAYQYQGSVGYYRNNFTKITGISAEKIGDVKPAPAGDKVNDVIEGKLAAAKETFKGLSDGERRYKELSFSIVKLVSQEKYHEVLYGIVSSYGYAHLLGAIDLNQFSDEEIVKLAALALRPLKKANGSRLYLFEHFDRYISPEMRSELISAFGVDSVEQIHGKPFFPEAIEEWEKCRRSGLAFDSMKYFELNEAAEEVGKENAAALVEKREHEKEEERKEEKERQRTERIDSSVGEQLIRQGTIKNGKAPASCPSCGSIHEWKKVATDTKGVSAGKAAVGAVIAGTAGGIVGGALGKKVDTYRCSKCGFTHDYPHDVDNKNGSDVLQSYMEQRERNRNNANSNTSQVTWGQVGLALLGAIVVWFLVFQFAACTR